MLAAGLDAKRAGELAADFPGEDAVAAYNSPNSVTFSGKAAATGVFQRPQVRAQPPGLWH
jgi:acyl transferase domain-containing protein